MLGALAQTQSHIHTYIQADRGTYRDRYIGSHIYIHWLNTVEATVIYTDTYTCTYT